MDVHYEQWNHVGCHFVASSISALQNGQELVAIDSCDPMRMRQGQHQPDGWDGWL